MRTRTLSLIGGVLIGLAALTATQGLLAAQESTPTADEAGMMETAATDGETAAKMGQMMDQCLAMMKMMSVMGGMMGGGDMQGMEGMEDMPQEAATPGA